MSSCSLSFSGLLAFLSLPVGSPVLLVLAVCVAAAVLELKKAVSAVAAAVVGIGLFTAPMESAQGQGFASVPIIFSVDIDCDSDDFVVSWTLSTNRWPDGHFSNVSYLDGCFYEGGYTIVTLVPAIWNGTRWVPDFDAGQWIQIWVWMGEDDDSIDGSHSAYVYDSEGNFYYVDLYIDDYGPWPTW